MSLVSSVAGQEFPTKAKWRENSNIPATWPPCQTAVVNPLNYRGTDTAEVVFTDNSLLGNAAAEGGGGGRRGGLVSFLSGAVFLFESPLSCSSVALTGV